MRLAPIALLAACNAPPGPPEPRPTAVTPPVLASASSQVPPAPANPDACHRGPSHYGPWTPSAADVMAIVPRLRDVDCGDPAWRGSALASCMRERGQSSVTVRFEAAGEPGHQPFECSLAITGAAWNGRRFLVVHDTYFQAPTAWGYTNVYELTARGPVLFLDGVTLHSPLCQAWIPDPTAARPPGWSAFPGDLQEVLCHP